MIAKDSTLCDCISSVIATPPWMFHINGGSSRVAQGAFLVPFFDTARCNRHMCLRGGSGPLQPSVLHFVRDEGAQEREL